MKRIKEVDGFDREWTFNGYTWICTEHNIKREAKK
jgi:hypothetical protein